MTLPLTETKREREKSKLQHMHRRHGKGSRRDVTIVMCEKDDDDVGELKVLSEKRFFITISVRRGRSCSYSHERI